LGEPEKGLPGEAPAGRTGERGELKLGEKGKRRKGVQAPQPFSFSPFLLFSQFQFPLFSLSPRRGVAFHIKENEPPPNSLR
jgi:hypothetical protein